MLLSIFTKVMLKGYIATGIILHSVKGIKTPKNTKSAKGPKVATGNVALSLNK